MNARRLVQKALLLLFGLLLALSSLELAVRVWARLRQQDRTLTYDRALGWKLNPFAKRLFRDEAQPYFIQINSAGLRDREHNYGKPPHVFRILVLGDSFVFGSGGVEQSDRFTELLEKFSTNLEVINMGVPGFSTDQEYLYLKTEGLKYHPDLVLLCIFANDFPDSFVSLNVSIQRPKGYFSSQDGHLIFHPPSFSYFYQLSQQSYLFALTERGLRKVWRGYGIRQPKLLLDPEERVNTFKLLLVRTRDLCREAGAELVVVYLPFQGQRSKSIIQEVMEEMASTENMKTLDLMEHMRKADATRPAYFRNDIHFNQYGHQAVAAALGEFLTKQGILKLPSQGRGSSAPAPYKLSTTPASPECRPR